MVRRDLLRFGLGGVVLHEGPCRQRQDNYVPTVGRTYKQ
jgi:hypothetical protein